MEYIKDKKTKKSGFALVIAIVLMAFLLLLVISLATLTQVEINVASEVQKQKTARENAYFGLMVAMGELQKAAGPDQRITGRADMFANTSEGAEHWTGVWDTETASMVPVWLSSGENVNPAEPGSDVELMVGGGTLGSFIPDGAMVYAEKVEVNGGMGNTAWWISDEGTKADISDGWDPASLVQPSATAPAALMAHRYFKPDSINRMVGRRVPVRRGVEAISPSIDLDGSHYDLQKMTYSLGQMQIWPGLEDDSNVKSSYHDMTLSSYGLLTRTDTGGFKRNLSDPTLNEAWMNDSIRNVMYQSARATNRGLYNRPYMGVEPFVIGEDRTNRPGGAGQYEPDPVLAISPPGTPAHPVSRTDGSPYAFFAPVMSELAVKFGLIHVENTGNMLPPEDEDDAQVTMNSNIFAQTELVYELWNPYPFTLELTRQSYGANNNSLPALRIFVSNFNYSQPLRMSVIRNDTEQYFYEFDMNNMSHDASMPWNRMWNTDLTVLPYIERYLGNADGPTTSRPPGILYSGEVYAGRRPYRYLSDARHYQVMNRNLGSLNWRLVDNDGEEAPAGYTAIYPSDTIDVTATGTFDISVLSRFGYPVRPYQAWDGVSEDHVQIQFKNIPFVVEVFDMPMDAGQEQRFSFQQLSEYHRNNFQFGVHIRLRDDLTSLARLAELVDIRQPIIDLSIPEIRDLFDIRQFPRDGNNAELALFDRSDLLMHDSDNSWGPDNFRYWNYSDFLDNTRPVKLFDVPTISPNTLDFLRHTYFEGMPAYSFGEPQGSETGTINSIYDEYFLTGVPPASSQIMWSPSMSPAGELLSPLPNPRLAYNPVSTAVESATDLQNKFRGQNAGSELLVKGNFNLNSTSPLAWEAALRSPTMISDDLMTVHGNIFIHMPHQPGLDDEVRDALNDEELAALSGDTFRNVIFMQTVRKIPETSSILRLLSEEIVDGLKMAILERGRPFTSIEEFANAGIIADAIDRVGLNEIGGRDLPAISPLYISQGKILGLLSSFASTRSDTFVIRSYGDSLNPVTGAVDSRVWCEALVQRVPDYVNDLQTRDVLPAGLDGVNAAFGRQFKIISFRWLDESEI